MHLASVWLREERVSVAEAAARLGYDAEASFSRAFKRIVGVTPSTVRASGVARLDRRASRYQAISRVYHRGVAGQRASLD